MKKTILTLLTFSFALALHAQNLPIKSVSIFKNQRALVHREGTVPTSNGKYSTTDLPDALWGTFWMDGEDLDYVFSKMDSSKTKQEVSNTYQLFAQNIGKKIKLWITINDTESKTIEGVLEKALQQGSAINVSPMTLVLRKTDGHHVLIDPKKVAYFEFLEEPNYASGFKEMQKRLDIGFKTKKTEQSISQQYLTGGIGWTPIYRLDLKDKKNGTLSLRGELVNNVEDLKAADLRLMVGMPNFIYATKLSDMLMFRTNVRYGWEIPNARNANQHMNQTLSNIAYDQSFEEIHVPANGGEIGGAQAEDYFFYSVKTGDFPKNSRYQVPIFETNIKTTHFYECVLNPIKSSQIRYNQNHKEEDRNIVNHLVEFRNETKFPWTTGVANIATMVGNELQPISQDKLNYTASRGKSKVKIAETPEIQVSHIEGTTATTPNALQYWNRNYDKASIEGQICVVNYKNEKVTIKIRRNVEGTMLESDEKWSVTQEEASLSVNRKNEVLWEIELKPNEEKKWKYSYEVFGDW